MYIYTILVCTRVVIIYTYICIFVSFSVNYFYNFILNSASYALELNSEGRWETRVLPKIPSARTNWNMLRQNVGNKYGEPPPNFRMKTISTCHCHWKLS